MFVGAMFALLPDCGGGKLKEEQVVAGVFATCLEVCEGLWTAGWYVLLTLQLLHILVVRLLLGILL